MPKEKRGGQRQPNGTPQAVQAQQPATQQPAPQPQPQAQNQQPKNKNSRTSADCIADLKNLGVRVDPSLSNKASDSDMRKITESVENLISEFPQLRAIPDAGGGTKTRDAVKSLGAGKLGAGVAGQAGFDGSITFDINTIGTKSGLRGTASHETGHLIERALILKKYASKGACMTAWNNCTEATRVVGEACKTLKAMPQYKGMHNDDFVGQVSNYALTNRSEALAECVRDYTKNGSSARPLSQEVWKILKKELG